jgi:hypothetical protein
VFGGFAFSNRRRQRYFGLKMPLPHFAESQSVESHWVNTSWYGQLV